MPDVSFPLAHLNGAEEMLCELSPCGAGAMGDRRPTQSLAGGWHLVGSSISGDADKSSARTLHFLGNEMQRAPVCPATG